MLRGDWTGRTAASASLKRHRELKPIEKDSSHRAMSRKISVSKNCWFCLLTLVLLLTTFERSQADALVSWDFSGLDYTGFADNSPVPNPVLTPAAAGAVAGVTVSDLTASGLTTSTGNLIAGEGNFKNWDVGGDGVNDNYLEFTLEAPMPGGLSVDSIAITLWRNGGGAPNGIAFDVSVDGAAYALYDDVQIDANAGDMMFDTFTFDGSISGISSLGVRFTPRNAGAGSTGNLHISGLQINGAIVPEPASLTMLLCGVAPFLFRSRRHR